MFSVLFSDSDSSDSSNSDCVFLYAKSRTDLKGEFGREICLVKPSSPIFQSKVLTLTRPSEIEITQFAEEVRREYSLYTEEPDVDFFRSKLDISTNGNEEDAVELPCHIDERVCCWNKGCFTSHLLSFDNNKVLKIINWIC